MKPSHVHPFPARMASELALDKTRELAKGSVVLDPMVGSGTVLRAAAQYGYRCIGLDVDPLAVLMTKVATSRVNEDRYFVLLDRLLRSANRVDLRTVHLPWFDKETKAFVEYWFAPAQRRALTRLASAFHSTPSLSDDSPEANALRLTLSKLIIAKERGASLGRDVSHSRPHRVSDENDFDVLAELEKVGRRLLKRISLADIAGKPVVRLGDARTMRWVRNSSVDMIMTSPPYLNAIDYMRGHRLSLIWLGYPLSSLRTIRANSVGAERGVGETDVLPTAKSISTSFGQVNKLPLRDQRIVDRYSVDLVLITRQVARALKPTGQAVFVVGNSCLKNVFVSNAAGLAAAASLAGLHLVDSHERDLPASSRYLPMPKDNASALGKRMRTETVLTFSRIKRAA